MATLFKTVFWDTWSKAINQGMVPGKEQSARDWFRNESTKLVVPRNENKFLAEMTPMVRRDVRIGFMYMFLYDPKLKEELPYYDRFPLVFPFTIESDRFRGINLHYLPRPLRARLMDALYTLAVNKNYTDRQKLALSYQIMKGVAKFKGFEPCIHEYLFSHVETPFYKVSSQYWDIALFLPTERFQKASKTKVWADSQAKIRKKWGKS